MNTASRVSGRICGMSAVEGVAILAVVALLGAFSHAGQKHELEAAERSAMESQARAIGDALQARLAPLVVQGAELEIARLVRQNPVDFLRVPPANYLGVLKSPPVASSASGLWYFDEPAGELVYGIRRGGRFVPDAIGRRQVRFRVELVQVDRGSSTSTVGAIFRPVHIYRWR